MKAAAIQMVSDNRLEQNLERAAYWIARATAGGAQLLVLPESFALFGDSAQLQTVASQSGYLQGWLSEQARRNGCVLVGGTVPVASDDGRAWASCYVHDADGKLLTTYRKIHLFDAAVADAKGLYRESADFRPGAQPCVVDTSLGKLGVAVCYDLRFPAQFQWMREQGAEILAIPSAFTRTTGAAHWLLLLRARAVETQCLVVGANQGGIHSPQRSTSGGSALVDAWGEVLAETGFGEGVVCAEWDRDRQNSWRAAMPVVANARFSVSPPKRD